MSEVNKSQAAAGVINFGEVVVTQDKKFKPREEFNNLCQAHLVSVEIKETETPKVDENGVASTYEYGRYSCTNYLFFVIKKNPFPVMKLIGFILILSVSSLLAKLTELL